MTKAKVKSAVTAAMLLISGWSTCLGAEGSVSAEILTPAYELLNERVEETSGRFHVYRDAASGSNHGYPSGFFGSSPAVLSKLHINAACVFDAGAQAGCATDPRTYDRTRGTVLRITFDPLDEGEFLGLHVTEPENFTTTAAGFGYDLRGSQEVLFDAMSPAGGIAVEISVGGSREHVTITPGRAWNSYSFPLSAFGLSQTDLSKVNILFTIVTSDRLARNGGTVLLDNIRFAPVPAARQQALGFPRANDVHGVIPVDRVQPGRVSIPPDQVHANLSTIYESSVTGLALLGRATSRDLESARLLAETFVYALDHPNSGAEVPASPNGAALQNAHKFGSIALVNDQAGGEARRGQVQLAGFLASTSLCGPTGYCLVLDGATGGNNAFVGLFLLRAWERFGDARYLDAARRIGAWMTENLWDRSPEGFGGFWLGYPDEGVYPKTLMTGKSIENNADIYAFLASLSHVERVKGDPVKAALLDEGARAAGDFVMAMLDPATGRFFAGTVPKNQPPSAGIQPDGPRRGNEVVNTADFLDSQTFTALAMAESGRYRQAIDWRRPVRWMLSRFDQSVTASGTRFRGTNIVDRPTAGPSGVAWEFTGQAVLAMKLMSRLYETREFDAAVTAYLESIRAAQTGAPFTGGRGLPASTLQDGDRVPPYECCLSTPFQCIAQRTGLAATAWAVFAAADVNPLAHRELDEAILLSRDRVAVTVSWRNQYSGASGTAHGVKASDQYASFWFDSPSNPEVFVKVLDFGGDGFLVFHSSLSDLEYTVTFVVLRTGRNHSFKREAGSVCGLADGSTVKK
ncbi:MAG: hypothetical protein L6R30_25940 [Thermoanaerobaculia bacterium]|nr:hypothetical protein [Thermoanaerobaculia bacterium]